MLKKGSEVNLKRMSISLAEKHNSIQHLVSVYDPQNDQIEAGLSRPGPRILNFANILKYNHIPLAKTIEFILDVGKESLGSTVEIEYAVDLNKAENGLPSFYLLQIKPMLGSTGEFNVDISLLDKQSILIYAERSMGNGKIENISEIIYVKPESFNKLKTKEIASEIEEINRKMKEKGKNYILIGPGRWGSSDPFIGIPVKWSQISMAKVIIETSMEDFPLDVSLGSHFFHNVTSMNVGYFSIQHSSLSEFIDWEDINRQKVLEETDYLKYICFPEPLNIIMDGKKQISLVNRTSNSKT